MPSTWIASTGSLRRSRALVAFVLPEQGASLAALKSRFPEGIGLRRYNRQGRLLFDIWAVGDAAQSLSSVLP